MVPHVLTNQSLTVLLDGRSIAIPRTHANFDAIMENLDDVNQLRTLLDIKQAVSDFTSGKIEVRDRVLYFDGVQLETNLTRKIIEFLREGNPKLAQPLINFLTKVMENPSRRAVQGLYDWVSASNMPIHEDGDILAWKIVKSDFHDAYSGRFDHTPGKIVEQPRNQCDEDPDVTCSYGLHFCSYDYLPNYYNTSDRKIVLVKIHPRDVVAIPRDYNLAKGRCCRMEVLQEVPEPEGFFPSTTVYFDPDPTFEIGQIWQDDWGDDHRIINIDDDHIYTVEVDTEDRYTFNLEGKGPVTSLHYLVEETPEGFDFQVGHRYLCRDGQVREVTDVGHSIVWFDRQRCEAVYEDNGKVYSDGANLDAGLDVIARVWG